MLVGYARVSTLDQETRLQRDALRRAGVKRVFEEKTSGVSRRPQLQAAIASVRPGDVLVVWKLDRLARSLRDLLDVLERLDDAGAGIRSLSEPIDTASPAGRLMVQVLGSVAEFERSLIRERSMAGQRAAIARGIVVGRPRSLGLSEEAELVRLWRTRWYTMGTLAAVFDVHVSSVKRAIYRVERPGHSSLQ